MVSKIFCFWIFIFTFSFAQSGSSVEYQSGTTIEVSSGAGMEADAFSGDGTVVGGDNIIIGGNPLPVELVSFSAKKKLNSVILEWQTATEVNNYGFEIERVKPYTPLSEGLFEAVGFVQGHGNSNSPKSYTFIDNNPTAGKVVYRLKQIDTDGSFSYSPEVEIVVDIPRTFALHQNYPNPFGGAIHSDNPTTTITFTLAEDGLTTLKIYDILGNEVSTLVNRELNAGQIHVVKFEATSLESGVYFYKLASKNQTQMKKFILIK